VVRSCFPAAEYLQQPGTCPSSLLWPLSPPADKHAVKALAAYAFRTPVI
jgi:hypothetical protein